MVKKGIRLVSKFTVTIHTAVSAAPLCSKFSYQIGDLAYL